MPGATAWHKPAETFHFAYDERWCVLAIFRDSDTSPKEEYVYHNAGADGYGSSSYIDAVVLRDKDANVGWTSAADGTLETRDYYCQNWRADVVAMVTDVGAQVEQVRPGAYGVPFGIPKGDIDGDKDVNVASGGGGDTVDTDLIQTWIGGTYDVRGDLDLDGDVDMNDKTAAIARAGTVLGWGKLSFGGAAGGNRKGYAGYEFDPVLAYSLWHVRHRVLDSDSGRWMKRDLLGYVDGPNVYSANRLNPVRLRDHRGLAAASPPVLVTTTELAVDSGCNTVAGHATFLFRVPPQIDNAWVIQKIHLTYNRYDCAGNLDTAYAQDYLEAWYLPHGSSEPTALGACSLDPATYTDYDFIGNTPNTPTFGQAHHDGEIRVVFDHEFLPGEDPGTWPSGSSQGLASGCLWTKDLEGLGALYFWQYPQEAHTAYRTTDYYWNCCDECGSKDFTISVNPSTSAGSTVHWPDPPYGPLHLP